MRFLRSYRHVAEQIHWCDNCLEDIEPGESYEASVYASTAGGRKSIVTIRNHVDPDCDPPEDPEDDEDFDEKIVSETYVEAA